MEQFGPYRVVQTVGRGGMGAVYEGVHESTGERCAIKVLADWVADDEEFRQRFQGEIETLKQLSHPHIVKMTGFGEQEGRLFYTMELVDGPNLQELLKSGRVFQWEEVAEIAIQICGALKHAHDRGIIHRDLKPANLLWSERGEGLIMLTDFGIAKLFGGSQVTMAGGVIGTADYMAPEQASARPVTAKSDLYSLGSVMYALISKRPPFRGPSKTQVLDDLMKQPPLPLGRLVLGIPSELEAIVSQLLEKSPEDRISSATMVAKRLKALLHAHRQGKLQEEDDGGDTEEEFIISSSTSERTQMGRTELGKTLSTDETQAEPPERSAGVTDQRSQETAVEAAGATELSGPSTTFTQVDNAPQGTLQSSSDAQAPESAHSHWLSIGGLLLCMALVVGIGWRLSLPEPAEDVYLRIRTIAAAEDHSRWVEVRDQIDAFLRNYPEDGRRNEVLAWRDDHEWYKFWRQLERSADKQGDLSLLGKPQRAFVEAARLDNAKSSEAAVGAYQAAAEFVAKTRADDVDPDPALDELASHIQHRLGRLQPRASPSARSKE